MRLRLRLKLKLKLKRRIYEKDFQMFRTAIVYHNRRVSALAAVLLDNSVHNGLGVVYFPRRRNNIMYCGIYKQIVACSNGIPCKE